MIFLCLTSVNAGKFVQCHENIITGLINIGCDIPIGYCVYYRVLAIVEFC
jgi:hypothetical protein